MSEADTIAEGPFEGENFEVRRGRDDVPILILCEHAGKAVPDDIDLGVSDALIDSHWGWDRWAYETLLSFAAPLGATTLGSKVSRLVIDLNRGPEDPTLILPSAGGEHIPGNQGLSDEAIAERARRLYTPYHDAADRELTRILQRHPRERVVFFTFHSFTGDYEDQDREFDVGVLFDEHEDLAAGVKRALATSGLRVRLNEPYSGFRGEIYSASVHAEAHDVPVFEIEVNQHVLEDRERRAKIASVFQTVVPAIFPHLPSRPG